jgi:16S rRNA (guanine527-N7)-methyltransferase
MNTRTFRELLDARATATNVRLPPELAERLEAYYRLLAHWNSRINLTSLALDPLAPQTVDRLFIEPIIAASFVPRNVDVWFDLGTGGGSPAIPLQLAHPAKRLIMVESRHRKAAFLREAIRELFVSGVEVDAARIEEVARRSDNAGLTDLVSVRAVKMAGSLFGDIQTLLRPGGQALLFGTRRVDLQLPLGLQESESTLEKQLADNRIVVIERRLPSEE